MGTAVASIAPALAAPTRFDPLQSFEDSLGASLVGSTIVRTRGYITIFNGDQAAGDVFSLRVTAYIGNNNEVQRGPNANDNAFDELSEGKDYFLFEPFVSLDLAQVQVHGTDPMTRMIDVKSSRKIEELNQTVVLDVSAGGVANPAVENIGFALDLSMLLMLP